MLEKEKPISLHFESSHKRKYVEISLEASKLYA